jgi:hypothetical protein
MAVLRLGLELGLELSRELQELGLGVRVRPVQVRAVVLRSSPSVLVCLALQHEVVKSSSEVTCLQWLL